MGQAKPWHQNTAKSPLATGVCQLSIQSHRLQRHVFHSNQIVVDARFALDDQKGHMF